jgi:hypothetical protein
MAQHGADRRRGGDADLTDEVTASAQAASRYFAALRNTILWGVIKILL